jgi:hypothetical protein
MSGSGQDEAQRHPVWVVGVVLAVVGGFFCLGYFFFAAVLGVPVNYGWVVAIIATIIGLVMVGFGVDMKWPNPGRTTPTAAPAGDVDQLERLAKLHRDGALTDDEYAAAKKRALGA